MSASASSMRSEAPSNGVYARTEAGRRLLAAPRNSLSVRERQILLLCTGERDAEAMEKVFGTALWPDLQRLMEQGMVRCVARQALPDFLATQSPATGDTQEADFSTTLPPLDMAASRSANQSGFGNTRSGAPSPLQMARVEAARLLIELGGAEAIHLRRNYAGVQKENDVLAFAARAIGLAEQRWGLERAVDRACRIGEPLPRVTLSRLLDAMVGYVPSGLSLALYERWLADTEFTDPGLAAANG